MFKISFKGCGAGGVVSGRVPIDEPGVEHMIEAGTTGCSGSTSYAGAVLLEDPGVLLKNPGILFFVDRRRRSATKKPGILLKDPGVL